MSRRARGRDPGGIDSDISVVYLLIRAAMLIRKPLSNGRAGPR
jgi:hypothetical protein